MDIGDTLKKLQGILGGRTMKDLLSNVDPNLLPSKQSVTSVHNSEATGAQDPTAPVNILAQKISQLPKEESKDEKHEKEKKKKKKKKKDKEKHKDSDRPDSKKKKKHTMRYAAGEMYEDPNLEDWPEDDYRIFVYNLGNEVTDEMLAIAFRRYQSFNKARVLRDKLTSKTRGFGFISLLRLDDYIKAMKEMPGVYVGNRPLKLSRSKWKDRSVEANKDKIKDAVFVKHKKLKKDKDKEKQLM